MLRFKNSKNVKIELIIFCFSMFIFLILGILLSYSFDFTDNINLLFQSDTKRVIWDVSTFVANHYRISVHPLFLIIMQPLYFIVNLIITNKMLTIIFLASLASSITIVFIYKILSLFSNNTLTKILITMCYAFSFGSIVFTSGIEVYNFAALFLVILFYYFIKEIKDKNVSNIIFIILGIFSAAFTITNFIVFLIIIFVLVISKHRTIKGGLYIILFSLFLVIDFNFIQTVIWPDTPFIINNSHEEENYYINYDIDLENASNVIKNDLSNSLIANDLKINVVYGYSYIGSNYVLTFENTHYIKMIFILLFYLMLLLMLIRNFKKNVFINIGIILTLLFNFSLHLVYGNTDSFLYSMHFLYLIFLLLGINLLEEKNIIIKKISNIFLSLFILFEIIVNSTRYIKLLDIVSNILSNRYIYTILNKSLYFIIISFISLLIAIGLYLMIRYFNKMLSQDGKKNLIKLILITLLFKMFFIGLNYIQDKIIPNSFVVKNTSDISNYVHSNLENHFIYEYLELKNYEIEYETFINEYKPNIVRNLNNNEFYFFGLANRRKLAFLKKGLFDIKNNKYIYKFEIKDYMIIPNLYMVVIETLDGDFIKIYENDDGVFYNVNGKVEIISGTETKITLYNFKNQKYSRIKKVLYSEILFNIQDSKIYPNIFVYNNVWYRDAAYGAMILKETDNTNLISEWIMNIEEIYDRQNNGINEPDNLGELLYIISTQEKYNYKLIDKIKEEAEKLTNKLGYINGQTDFKDRPIYQNMWYKLGIEKIGEDFKYKIPSINDDYGNLIWWNKNYTDKQHNYNSNYPYLKMAEYHKIKKGKFYVNEQVYPLSWEKNASAADYQKMVPLGSYYVESKISPTHTWAAAEMLLFLLDETNDLKYK